ncbi:carboxymuconolactone decarboxylase family protein [Nonomuraea longispora]|uniref:Carboxymuconolactone decarboxylase family protein n=1 Tax=Nonomuraea longispora TaxID=1848320 RepID=A0A4R4MMW7_9ACTN|nr:carboxymuconolactone decarboxylase family protein [Nonomuraea longispora]TDB97274.1 carboxymuconolactone decarboxylase family protein [Nonomuraea longispora]
MTDPAMETVDSFGMMAERQFAEVWSRTALSDRERRLLLLGLSVGQGLDTMTDVQLDAALRTGDLTEPELREVVIFLTHYAGWIRGARLNGQVEELIEQVRNNPAGDPPGCGGQAGSIL